MTAIQLEKRLTAVEDKLSHIQELLERLPEPVHKDKKWIEEIWGSFSDDPLFEEAVRLGRKWRDSENRKSLRKNGQHGPKKRQR